MFQIKRTYMFLNIMYYRRRHSPGSFRIANLVSNLVTLRDSIHEILLVLEHAEPKINFQLGLNGPSAGSQAFLSGQLQIYSCYGVHTLLLSNKYLGNIHKNLLLKIMFELCHNLFHFLHLQWNR